MYPEPEPCEVCGQDRIGRRSVDRHHRDGDPLNNARENIAFLCRLHHKAAHRALDGRIGGGPRPRIAALLRDRAMEKAALAWTMLDANQTPKAIAAHFGVDLFSVYRWFRKYPR